MWKAGTFAILIALGIVACSTTPRVHAKDEASHWIVEIAWQGDTKLGGCAVGDFDPRHAGHEIALVSGAGTVEMVRREGEGYTAERLFSAPGEMIQCAVGDADPVHPGDEIYTVGIAQGTEDDGGPGVAWWIRRTDDGWVAEKIFEDLALLHGVCVADGAVWVTGYTNRVFRLERVDGKWSPTLRAELPGAGKNAVGTPLGVVVACTDGSLVRVNAEGETTTIDKREAGRARLGADGDDVLACDDDGTLSLVTPAGRTELYRDDAKLRGAVLADLDPALPGLEAATAGYSGRLAILSAADSSRRVWRPVLEVRDVDRFHHVASGDLDGRPGSDLVASGYSGRVYVIRRAAHE